MHAATVAPELAHKADRRNLWLRSVVSRDATSVTFRFRIPDTVRPGIAEYVEVQRQATHAFAHLHLDVPLDGRAMLSTAEMLLDAGGRSALPCAGSVTVRANIDGRAARGVADIDVGVRFIADAGTDPAESRIAEGRITESRIAERRIAEGRITGKYLPRRLYDRIRGSNGSAEIAAETDGHEIAAEAGGTDRFAGQVVEALAVEAGNPILGDHETDHISGMVVVCAVERLAAKYFPARRLRELTTTFFAFIEKSEQAYIVVLATEDRIVATVTQGGRVCARAEGGFGGECEGGAS